MSNIIDKIRLSGVTYTLSATSAGGSPTVELTQAEYDALVSAGTVSADTYYIISDAPAVDISNYWTSAQTQSAITEATSGKASQSDVETVSGQVANKQDTLVSGTNIKTINNESILGSGNITIQGGGGTYTPGRGIDITGGEISVSLPISAGTGTNSILEGAASESTAQNAHAEGEYTHATGRYSHAEGAVTYATNNAAHAEGYSTYANGNRSHAEGAESVADGDTSHAEGKETRTKNFAEHASGAYNVSSSASTTFGDSGNTLFSVGNGTSDNARHNAFEIRQNGDIYITSGGTDIKLQDNLGGGGSVTIDPSLDSGSTNPVANSAITTVLNTCLTDEAYWDMVGTPRKNVPLRLKRYGISGYKDIKIDLGSNLVYGSEGFQTLSVSGVVETSAITTSISSSSTDSQVPSAKAVYDALGSVSGGISSAECQSMIDSSISGKADSSSLATVATSGSYDDLTNKLSAGTNITIVDNVISATGGGGKAIEAGRGIAITTGATADTVSFNLPISAGTGSLSIAENNDTVASGMWSHAEGAGTSATSYASHAEGKYCSADGDSSHAEGHQTQTNNFAEHASGRYNVSSSGSSTFGDSGNTLFSVGNGTAEEARHNAFEIRQNGDIYCSDGTNDVKLQDTLTATAANTTALGGLKLVKLTQSEYDNLSTKDNSTLYVIVN